MTSSYEARIVNAVLKMVEAEERGDEERMGDHLVAALLAAKALRSERNALNGDDTADLEARRQRDTERETHPVKP